MCAAPHAVMLGNSMQQCGVDFAALSEAIGKRVESQVSGGVMSAHKFAMLWHAVRAQPKPAMAVIVFRLDNITRPRLRVTEKYGDKLREILTDPELLRIVTEAAFAAEPRDPALDFDASVARSFVPHMVREARQAGVRLVLVRCKSRAYAENPDLEDAVLEGYSEELAAWLQASDVHFVDYLHEPRVELAHYGNGDHLNGAGKQTWTPLLAQDLQAILSGRRGPRERTDLADPRPPL